MCTYRRILLYSVAVVLLDVLISLPYSLVNFPHLVTNNSIIYYLYRTLVVFFSVIIWAPLCHSEMRSCLIYFDEFSVFISMCMCVKLDALPISALLQFYYLPPGFAYLVTHNYDGRASENIVININ